MNLNKIFKIIYNIAKKEKVDVYAVGGFARDRLLGIENSKDVDFVVIGSGLEFAKAFDKEMKSFGCAQDKAGSLVEFPDFDTARYIVKVCSPKSVVRSQIELEFAGARSESYDESSRKPKVKATNLEIDLQRRDFTINAMAQKVGASGLSKIIVDPFGGQLDLKNKIIRTPLNPDTTFSEDPLRMLRAARFASQLGFMIEANTYEAMGRNCKRLRIVSAERIQEEFLKLLSTKKPSIGLRILYDAGLFDMFLPEVKNLRGVEEIFGQIHKDVLEHTFKVVDNIAEKSDKVMLRFAGLMHDIGKPATKKFVRGRGWTFDMHEHLGKKFVHIIGRRLRFSADDTKYVAKLVRWHQQPIGLMDEKITDSAIRRLIVTLGDELDDLLILCRSDITTGNPMKKDRRLKNYDYLENRIAEVLETDKLRAFQSPVRGEEIMKECGLKPGPTIGRIKDAIEEAILDGKIKNDYGEAKKYFERIKDRYLKEAQKWEKI
ncbi:MAG: HD domain-containing protein [Candidatus Magasanikbacteria bacterium]|nr:HD domain-containing protein [Candidatus Magasanikbacteria bacterium]